MKHELKKLENSQVELTVTVEPSEYEKHLKSAATRLSERANIKGFRKGKAPYDIVKRELGDMSILQEALERIIQESFYEAIKTEEVETIGMPDIKVEKLAPGNEIIYKATVALLPKVTLADLTKLKAKKDEKEITKEAVDEVIENLRKMQAKEVIKQGAATKEDKVVVDMDMKDKGVSVEGGQAKGYGVYLSEEHYIPGFNEKLVGAKKGDELKFNLEFPEDHYQKNFAGKKIDFTVKVNDVYERQLPEANEEFAKALGQESVEKLRELLKENLSNEEKRKAEERFEIAIFEELLENSTFEEIPEVLINAERQKMFYELKRDLDRNGISIEDYLKDIKKKEDELFEDFKEQATKRAKSALVSRAVAHDNNIDVSNDELKAEIQMMKDMYKENEEYLENLKKPEVKDTIRNMLANKKVVAFLKEKVQGEKKEEKKSA